MHRLLVVIMLLGCCKLGDKATGSSAPPSNVTPAIKHPSPSEICFKLEQAGVAEDCKRGGVGELASVYRFRLPGLYRYHGTITRYATDKDYTEFAADYALFKTEPDDYPIVPVLAPTARTIISWNTDDAREDAWDACRKRKKVAACAKEQPEFYSAFRRLHEAAKQTAGE